LDGARHADRRRREAASPRDQQRSYLRVAARAGADQARLYRARRRNAAARRRQYVQLGRTFGALQMALVAANIPHTVATSQASVERLWRAAGNTVQWRP
jgi:hypothetical protein